MKRNRPRNSSHINQGPTLRSIPLAARATVGLSIAFIAGLLVPTLGVQANPPDPGKFAPSALPASSLAPVAPGSRRTVAEHSSMPVTGAASTFAPLKAEAALPSDWVKLGLNPRRAKLVKGRYVQKLRNGATVTLTLDPVLQKHVEKVFSRGKVPHGGLVVVEPSTGRVLAMVSHNDTKKAKKPIRNIARKAAAPSASVFKIVTAAALLEEGKVKADEKVCYHGGRSRLTKRNIIGSRRYDHRCGTLSDALAWSINSIMAKLSYNRLKRGELKKWAKNFGYNETIPFELPVAKSKAKMVKDPLERARTAAGFWNTFLSPLHGALIGAAVQNNGVMMRPTLIESYQSADKKFSYSFKPRVWKRVMKKQTAIVLQKMLKRTSTVGTARKYFRHNKRFPSNIIAGGKTGTLSRKTPSYLGYTWFVGFAYDKNDVSRNVAVGGVACNTPMWHIKGTHATSEAIRVALRPKKKAKRAKRTEVASR